MGLLRRRDEWVKKLELTDEQAGKVVWAIGTGTDWPKATDDPKVNHAVDCIVADEGDEPEYEEKLYAAEVEAFKDLGHLERVA